MKEKHIRAIVIRGGGLRGIASAAILSEFEERAGLRLAEMTDLIAGTSTGSILAAIATMPEPEYKMKDAVRLYKEEARTIFNSGWFRRTKSVLHGPKYSPKGLHSVAQKYFGDVMLSDCAPDVLIPAYDILRRKPRFFKSAKARQQPRTDVPLWKVVVASGSAQTFFPPIAFDGGMYIDGGNFANDPTLATAAEIRKLWPNHKITIITIGTGRERRYYGTAPMGWGGISWLAPTLDIVFGSQAQVATYIMRELAANVKFFEFDFDLPKGLEPMDAPENVDELHQLGRAAAATQSLKIDEAAQHLTG